ncbi:MAG: indolepyruvate/phenylpyruvate decarboxylase [Pseudomonadota bacterium]
MQLGHAFLQALKDHGAAEIFGIPGDFALPFFRQIEQSNILPLYTLSHEPAVGFAADAAGRYRRSLSVAAVTYGAGALNMVNPVATAYSEKSPLVVISGAPGAREGASGLGLHHQVKHLDSQRLVFNEVTCAQAVLDDAATAPGEIARVLAAARDLSRPVYIELPRDMVDAEVAPVVSLPAPVADTEAVTACAREILGRLHAADRPALLLGVEIRRYGVEDKVARLAHALDIPTATTFMARGVAAESEAPIVGTYLGLAGDPGLRLVVEGSDALLMLGVILSDTNFGVSARQVDMRSAVHAFDGEVRFGTHLYPAMPLPALLDALIAAARPIARKIIAQPPEPPRKMPSDGAAIAPADIAAAVNDLFARHGRMPIASDMGDCLFTAMDMVYTELAAPGYYATMGPGIPFGLGFAAASGRRPLVLVGDGAFQMTGWELGNCNRYGWKPIVLVFNNAAWGMLKAFQSDTGYNDLDMWRFAELAEGLGGRGRRATTRAELADALETAHADPEHWHLIDIILPRDAISRTLDRFTGAIKERSALAKEG